MNRWAVRILGLLLLLAFGLMFLHLERQLVKLRQLHESAPATTTATSSTTT
ncbi:MAG: hypothetical protein QOI24_2954 [Acidobacteriota bacterium]|jgi:hypothetical protein|nr:hypothetical protein [Acidobacteriota bacterium]